MADNPFAFPVPIGAQSRGMTLRDQAALAALQGLLAAHQQETITPVVFATASWAIADAWLAARDAEPTP